MCGSNRVASALSALAMCAALSTGCENYPSDVMVDAGLASSNPDKDQGDHEDDERKGAPPGVDCRKPEASDKLPARAQTLRRTVGGAVTRVTVQDLFRKFSSQCKGCHVDQNQGDFRIPTVANFVELADERILERVRSNDPALVMPPGAVPFDERPSKDDRIREFAALMETWLAAGKPDKGFEAELPPVSDTRYLLDDDVGADMTNLGNCIPGKDGFGTEVSRSAELDRMFEHATELPERLEQTDLFTLDSKELARHGVVAFAPAYTLWADNAKKVRMVRVPRGETIAFDKETQSFTIPPNTRFYKTFLKRVIDKAGNVSFRKIETRLILSRPDDPSEDVAPTERHRALFGTYAWNEAETEAVLVRDPLRDGDPKKFADRVLTYYQDEHEVELLIDEGNTALEETIASRDLDITTFNAGHRSEKSLTMLTRTYAIPGSERCIHCHMGAPTQSFVLGFTPLQLRRQPEGQSGVIEPAEADELNQLQRLIDYGIVSGMDSPADAALLENSQGERKPRNDYELKAQGYMLGNCAHCHNPRGFPSSTAVELREDVNFMPDGHDGGIFQFPLEKYSRRVFRGEDLNFKVPYITPSLYDRPRAYIKYRSDVDSRTGKRRPIPKLQRCGANAQEVAEGGGAWFPEFAPWRSLIYRNVDTPFSYSDDFAVFPHMPRDTPGFDCRAKQVLGEWMVSIPALPKISYPRLPTNGVPNYETWPESFSRELFEVKDNPTDPNEKTAATILYWVTPEAYFDVEQPYEEILPDDERYDYALVQMSSRMTEFQDRGRYEQCPDPEIDVVDPLIIQGLARSFPEAEGAPHASADSRCLVEGGIVPERAHWFDADLTEPMGEWRPRREDWFGVLAEGNIEQKPSDTTVLERNKNDRKTFYILTGGSDPWRRGANPAPLLPADQLPAWDGAPVRITPEFREFALTPFPMGLWEQKDECASKFESAARTAIPRASDYEGAARPRWMESWVTAPMLKDDPDAPVYTISPGAQVFTSICANCHGPAGDSKGRMADTIADMTGGATRVANLVDGIFGPTSDPGANRQSTFDRSIGGMDGLSADDWAARYVLWMGSGGTQRSIPAAVLNVVGTTRVLGQQRQGLGGLGDVGANMLALADFLCGHQVPRLRDPSNQRTVVRFDVAQGTMDVMEKYPRHPRLPPNERPALALMGSNGDDELWQKLCTFENPLPVRMVSYLEGRFSIYMKGAFVGKLWARGAYPPGAAVGDQRGRVQAGLEEQNVAPWCIQRPTEQGEREALETAFRAARGDVEGEPPYCPENLQSNESAVLHEPYVDLWTRRASMNAGLAVFAYLDWLNKAKARGEATTVIEYNHCQDLPEE